MAPKRKLNEAEASFTEGVPPAAAEAEGSGTGSSIPGGVASVTSKRHLSTMKVAKEPKTVNGKVIEVIRNLKAPSGSSAQSIIKGCSTLYGLQNVTAIKKALKTGVENGIFLKNKASYLVAGDPLYEDTSEKVEIEDVKLGTSGEAVGPGFQCTVAYIGTLACNAHQFDAGKSFTFTVGAGDVIKGMDAGVLGMFVGGRRIVTIPSSLGYGKRGSSPDIPPDSILCFDIKLKEAKPP